MVDRKVVLMAEAQERIRVRQKELIAEAANGPPADDLKLVTISTTEALESLCDSLAFVERSLEAVKAEKESLVREALASKEAAIRAEKKASETAVIANQTNARLQTEREKQQRAFDAKRDLEREMAILAEANRAMKERLEALEKRGAMGLGHD